MIVEHLVSCVFASWKSFVSNVPDNSTHDSPYVWELSRFEHHDLGWIVTDVSIISSFEHRGEFLSIESFVLQNKASIIVEVSWEWFVKRIISYDIWVVDKVS